MDGTKPSAPRGPYEAIWKATKKKLAHMEATDMLKILSGERQITIKLLARCIQLTGKYQILVAPAGRLFVRREKGFLVKSLQATNLIFDIVAFYSRSPGQLTMKNPKKESNCFVNGRKKRE